MSSLSCCKFCSISARILASVIFVQRSFTSSPAKSKSKTKIFFADSNPAQNLLASSNLHFLARSSASSIFFCFFGGFLCDQFPVALFFCQFEPDFFCWFVTDFFCQFATDFFCQFATDFFFRFATDFFCRFATDFFCSFAADFFLGDQFVASFFFCQFEADSFFSCLFGGFFGDRFAAAFFFCQFPWRILQPPIPGFFWIRQILWH